MSSPPLCHPVKTTELLSYIIPLTENVLHLCRTASSSYFKHVAEMTTLSGGHSRQVLQEDRITTASHSVLPGNCVHILGKKSGLFKVGVSIQQSCHLACLRFSWICVEAKPRSDSTAQGHYSGILADYRKTSSFHHLFHSWVCYSHLCTSCVKGFVLYKYHYPPITLRGQTDTADSWDCCLYSPSFTVNNPSQVSPLALV